MAEVGGMGVFLRDAVYRHRTVKARKFHDMAARDARQKSSPVRILVVDDSQVMRRCLRSVLEQKESWRVCSEASNGQEALDKAQQAKPDVIVLDLQMPIMNGLDAARELRRRTPDVPILMVSLHMSPQLEDQAKKVGIRGACDKGDVGCVVEGIDTLLHHGTYYRN